jgi:hypothetical protein
MSPGKNNERSHLIVGLANFPVGRVDMPLISDACGIVAEPSPAGAASKVLISGKTHSDSLIASEERFYLHRRDRYDDPSDTAY